MVQTEAAIRCSAWAREVALSPVASIGSYRGYVLVETALPWPRDIGEVASLGGITAVARQLGYRVQALVPSSLGSGPDTRRLILHVAGDGPGFAGYHRFETTAGDSLEAALQSLLDAAASESADEQPDITDLLVCTHGRRDVCCGSQGTDLALRLAAEGPPPGVAFWRTSHTGGHRFAPTFLVLPQGTGWAFADPDLVRRVIDRSVPFSDVAPFYRGCAGLDSPEGQAMEREVLASVGWELLDRSRSTYMTGETTGDGGRITRLESGSDRWEAVVRPGRTLPVPDCMKPLSEAKKSETEWAASDLRHLP